MLQLPAIDKSKTTPKNAIEFDKSYRVMDVRLLRDVENPLHGLQYAPEDTNYLRLIFGCGYDAIIAANHLSSLMPSATLPVAKLTKGPNTDMARATLVVLK